MNTDKQFKKVDAVALLTETNKVMDNLKISKEYQEAFRRYFASETNSGQDQSKIALLRNSKNQLGALVMKYANIGMFVDGNEVVITGRAMAQITARGYKAKILRSNPDATFDIQVVREGDQISFEKRNGKIIYSHIIGDPFGKKPIIGGYGIVKLRGAEHLEVLDTDAYEKMKAQSRQQTLWNKWDTEFWWKSILKRIAKKIFEEETRELEELDNQNYYDDFIEPELRDRINKAQSTQELQSIMRSLPAEDQKNAVELIRDRQRELQALTETQELENDRSQQ